MPTWDDLWGATLVDLDLDLLSRRLTITIALVTGTDDHTYDVTLEGVSDLRIVRPDSHSWDYTEITEAHVDESGPLVKFELVLWAEPNGLAAACESATVIRRP